MNTGSRALIRSRINKTAEIESLMYKNTEKTLTVVIHVLFKLLDMLGDVGRSPILREGDCCFYTRHILCVWFTIVPFSCIHGLGGTRQDVIQIYTASQSHSHIFLVDCGSNRSVTLPLSQSHSIFVQSVQ